MAGTALMTGFDAALNVKCNNDYSVQTDESLHRLCTNERRVRKQDKKVRRHVILAENGERGRGSTAAATCDGKLFHVQAAVTGNALSMTL